MRYFNEHLEAILSVARYIGKSLKITHMLYTIYGTCALTHPKNLFNSCHHNLSLGLLEEVIAHLGRFLQQRRLVHVVHPGLFLHCNH